MPNLALRLLALGLAATSAFAQVGRPDRRIPDPRQDYGIEFSHTGAGDLPGGGDVAVSAWGASWRHAPPFRPDAQGFGIGLEWTTHALDVAGPAPLPDHLHQVALMLSYQRPLTARWSAQLTLRPGLYGDFHDISGRDLNAPALLIFSYARDPRLVWLLGLNANPFGDNVVLPALGVRWQFAPAWTFSVGLPRTGVTYRAGERTQWHLGATLDGGSFHVSEALAPGLRRTLLDYREIRVGAGLTHRLGDALSLDLDVGTTLDRRFDYFDRGLKLKPEDALFVSLRLGGRF